MLSSFLFGERVEADSLRLTFSPFVAAFGVSG
jgi:hypothetical protein